MKLLKKGLSSVVLAASFLFASSFAANAVVIKHDILDGGAFKIGEIAVEFDNSLLDTGILDSGFGDPIALVDFNLEALGLTWAIDAFYFEAVVDSDNVAAGIEFFTLDADDVGFSPADTWSYQLLYDALDLNASFIDIFDAFGDVVFFDFISLGQAEVTGMPVTNVSAPATLGVFSLALAALYARRKQIS